MAKVVPLASAKAFLDALEKSSLLSADEVVSLRTSSGDDGDPRLIARDLVRDNKLTKWQAGQLLHGFYQLIVGKYKLMDQLGTGEMGRVYLGEHAQLARKVSLKILSRKYTANPEILKKVLEDGRQAAALDHRNLSHVFDVNSEDDRYYLVTEYVEGKDLGKLVEASGATSPAQASDIVRQAAEGLEYAHSKGVNHGDLKPSNLIVDASGIVKILDLGLARLTESSPAVNADESTEVATLAAQSYHAPEQASQRMVSPLVDIYSLGGILFYLLSGKSPLGGVKSAQEVKDACPAANDELAELCASMLAEDPADRPQSAQEVIAGLAAAVRAKPKPVAKEDKKSAKQKKPLVAKPLVAKPLEIPFPTAAAPKSIPLPKESSANDLGDISLDDANMVEQPPPAAEEAFSSDEEASNGESVTDDPFAGFTLETKRKKTKPAAKPAAEPVAAPAAAAPAAVPQEEAAPAPIKAGKKPSMAIVIGVGIGGGVLILALGVTVLVWAMTRGKPVDKTAIAKVENKQKDATTPPEEANPEANPELNPEANPTVEPPSTVPTKGPEKTTPATTPEGPKTTVPMPMPGAGDPTKAGNPPMPMPMTPVTTPAPMPMPPKPEPVKPAPMPEPMVPIGDPFVGFAKVVTLPPLEEKGKALPDATKPLLLGAVKLPPKALCLINLKGGENAIATSAKQKFVLEAGNNGTAERDWDFKLVTEGGGTPVTVATLALQNDQLNFQWTDDATKQLTAAPYLCNCALTMSAGMGSHVLALRQPITGEPLKIDLEKPMSAKFKIDYPPNPKQIVIQLGPPEGPFPKFKFEKQELTAKTDNTMFMTGPGDDVMLMHFKMVSNMSGPLLKIDALSNYQIHGMNKPEKYVKAKMNRLLSDAEAASRQALLQQQQVNANINQIAPDRRAQAEAEMKKLVEDTAMQKAQAEQLMRLIKDVQGEGKLHFHIYYEADTETKVDLVSTGAAPPMAAAP